MSGPANAFAARMNGLGAACYTVDAAGRVTPGDARADAVRRVADAGRTADAATTADGLLALPWADDVSVVDLSAGPFDAEKLAAVATHFHGDLRQAATDAVAIDGFSRQLSQSYEEVNLVYRMAKLLGSRAEPAAVVQGMCDELRATLNYAWLAMAFDTGDGVLGPLRGTVHASGTLPCDAATFVAHRPADADGRVLVPGRHPLATRAGGEVLAGRVTHEHAAIGTVLAGGRQDDDPDVSSSELQLAGAAADFLGLFHQNAFRFHEQRRQFLGTLRALSATVDAKDPYTRGHSDRVALLGRQLALAVGLDADAADAVRVAGLLHDIGKIGVPESVLRKPARLNDEEFALIKKHPEIGHDILKDIPSLAYHLPGVLHHHERWDGRGYPHGLAGEAIPMVARILAFADTFDAMSSSRAYRRGLDRGHVLGEIEKSGGTQLDPAMVGPFVAMDFAEFDALLARQDAAAAVQVAIAA